MFFRTSFAFKCHISNDGFEFFFSSMATSASGSDGAGGDRPPYHHTLLEGNCDLILILLEANCHLIFFVEIFE